jgi:HPt (histidine-containing phosphotransfer) domain-containing protein
VGRFGELPIYAKIAILPCVFAAYAERGRIVAAFDGVAGTKWDVKELLARLDGDQEFLCELLRIFREDSAANLEKASACLQKQDMQELARTAHTMKGMLRNLSMHRAGEIAYALEMAGCAEKGKDAEAFLAQLEQACAELLPEVEARLAGVEA